MQLTFTRNGLTFNLSPELIVVACDPRGLSSVMGQTSAERAIFKALQNFTFFTTTLKVRPIRGQDRKVILDPQICSEMAGIVHGFRNETAKQWGLDAAIAQDWRLNESCSWTRRRRGGLSSPAATRSSKSRKTRSGERRTWQRTRSTHPISTISTSTN